MASVSFKKGLLASLPEVKTEGTFYITTDERAIYLDVSASERIRLGDFQEFASVEALSKNKNPSETALYYITDINCLAKWNGSQYVQINKDTGAVTIEVTGNGNAITGFVSYDPTTRKFTLTKGETFATKAEYTTLAQEVAELTEQVGEDSVEDQISEAIEALNIESTYETKSNASATKSELEGKINKKQDALAFEGDYNAETNKVATMDDVKTAMAGLSGAMHWRGEVATKPADDENGKYAAGDVVSVNGVEYAYDGKAWVELGDEASHHEHSNLVTLNKITDSKLANWDAAYADKHTHANSAELDKVTSGSVDKWNAAEAKAHEHSNKTLLDTYKQTEENLADAVAKKHAHTNADELNKIASGDKAKWDAAASSVEEIESDYLTSTDKTELEGKINKKQDAIPANTYDAYGAASTAEQNAKSYADGLADNYDEAGAADDALAQAKTYTDEKVQAGLSWGSF